MGVALLAAPGDHAEVERWWRRAGQEADADTAFDFAGYLAERDGEAAHVDFWCRRTAEAGHSRAALNLGALLANRELPEEAEHGWPRRWRGDSTTRPNPWLRYGSS
ncbi:hypothetical protein P9869_09780 [Streptomyces ossamyceticus]|nr:hypothetical protein [Streptomyces ossamyceticus]